jgi:cell division transport system ATP-binding protein
MVAADMIRFDSVTKRYRGAPRPALDDVSLEIGAGEFIFLVGASGSGKSSLLRLMLREERATTGEIHVLGQRLTSISTRKVPYFRRSLGVVFQDFRLLPNKTVYDNVAFTLQVIGKSRGFIQTTVPDVLATVGLAEKSSNFPNELSGGEQQRVAIARAVVNKPSILLADEPTGNLDPRTSEGIMQVLERINQAGTTVVMATHDVTIVDRMQKRVVELVQGKIIRDELEATYVTSSIKLPKTQTTETPIQRDGSVPLWARRGAQAEPPQSQSQPQPQPQTVAQEVRPLRPTTGPIQVVQPAASTPIWARGETGPVLLPGEHAPWRATPVAPPEPDDDGRSLFFAAPVPAPRRVETGPLPIVPQGDADGQETDTRSFARHRDQLPDHLDFITGLGLRMPRSDGDDEVGPSS